jgi:hypothetical protein
LETDRKVKAELESSLAKTIRDRKKAIENVQGSGDFTDNQLKKMNEELQFHKNITDYVVTVRAADENIKSLVQGFRTQEENLLLLAKAREMAQQMSLMVKTFTTEFDKRKDD